MRVHAMPPTKAIKGYVRRGVHFRKGCKSPCFFWEAMVHLLPNCLMGRHFLWLKIATEFPAHTHAPQ